MPQDGLRTSRVVALALVVGIFVVAQEVLTDLAHGRSINLAGDVMVVLLFWIAWAFLTPAVLASARRWPLDAKPVYRPLLAHVVVALPWRPCKPSSHSVLRSIVRYLRDGIGFDAAVARSASLVAFVWGVFTGVFFYSVVVMVYTAVRFRTLYVSEQLSAAELARRGAALEAELTRSKLDTLRSQLRPHFLFNTLNAISVFVTEDGEKARQMLLRLSTLLRRSLDEEAHEVPLRPELAFVNDYLDIQRGRFGDQLTVQLAVDATVLDAHVPVFLLQPLLENAIEHGRSTNGRTGSRCGRFGRATCCPSRSRTTGPASPRAAGCARGSGSATLVRVCSTLRIASDCGPRSGQRARHRPAPASRSASRSAGLP